MITISLRDIQRIPELSHLSEIEMLSICNDKLIAPFLELLGMDLEYGVEYFPAIHRDLAGFAAVGFMLRGEVNINRNILNNEYGTLQNKLVAAAYTDESLCYELAELSGKSADFRGGAIGEIDDDYDIAASDVCEDYNEVSEQIAELYKLRDSIRGSAYNSSGAVKRFDEYEMKGQDD